MNCGSCSYTDGCCYTSMPPQVKCTITGEFHYYDDECNCEEARLQSAFKNIEVRVEPSPAYESSILINSDSPNNATSNADLIMMPTFEYCTYCLVCGTEIPVSMFEGGSKICDDCKKTIKFIKEKFKEELENYEV